jgi:ppGpp synthetase/RelA/SpoT-type nucleotidyltranferase
MSNLEHDYKGLREQVLVPLADELQKHISDLVQGVPRLDRVSARAKTVSSFVKKAAATKNDGTRRYDQPLLQIQDLVGARVTVFYLPDVETVSEHLKKYFHYIETRAVVPDSQWEFGYFGLHYIMPFPSDFDLIRSRCDDAPQFFELQIKTLFQHAWSEANHDLGYKPEAQPLDADETRSLAFASAQAWGADRVFRSLFDKLHRAEQVA